MTPTCGSSSVVAFLVTIEVYWPMAMTSQPMKRATLIALSIEWRTRKKFPSSSHCFIWFEVNGRAMA